MGESLVRPFQTPEYGYPEIVPFGAPTHMTPNVRLLVGRGNSVKTFQGHLSISTTSYNKKWPKETTLADALAGNVPTG